MFDELDLPDAVSIAVPIPSPPATPHLVINPGSTRNTRSDIDGRGRKEIPPTRSSRRNVGLIAGIAGTTFVVILGSYFVWRSILNSETTVANVASGETSQRGDADQVMEVATDFDEKPILDDKPTVDEKPISDEKQAPVAAQDLDTQPASPESTNVNGTTVTSQQNDANTDEADKPQNDDANQLNPAGDVGPEPIARGSKPNDVPYKLSARTLSGDGKWAAIVSKAAMVPPKLERRLMDNRAPTPLQLSIVEAANDHPQAEIVLPRPIRAIFFHDQVLYVITNDGLAAIEYDISSGNQKRVIPFTRPLTPLGFFGDFMIACQTFSNAKVASFEVLTLPDFTVKSAAALIDTNDVRSPSNFRHVADGWDFGSLVLDERFDQPLAVDSRALRSVRFLNHVPASAQRTQTGAYSAEDVEILVRTQPLVSQVSAAQPIKVPLDITGGTPPYRVSVTLPFAPITRSSTPDAAVSVNESIVSFDGAKLMDCLGSKSERQPFWELFRKTLQGSAVRSGDPVGYVQKYILDSQQALKPFVPQQIKGVPFGVLAKIDITDADSNAATHYHPIIIEVPSSFIRDASEQYAGLKPTEQLSVSGVATGQKEPKPILLRGHVDDQQVTPDLPLVWKGNTAADLSVAFRDFWSGPGKIPRPQTLEQLAAIAVIKIVFANERFPNVPVKGRHVDGTVLDGETQFFSNDSIGYDVDGIREAMIPLTDLETPTLMSLYESLRNEFPLLEVKLAGRGGKAYSVLGSRIEEFRDRFGCYPPPAIVDSTGEPLLSWRVLLLPKLGYGLLYSLFRLDEPWDSQHNRKLIPFMPPIYVTKPDLDPGLANVVAVTGAQTMFPHHQLRRSFELRQAYVDCLTFAILDDKHAVVWTKPEDIDIDQPGWSNALAKQAMMPRPSVRFTDTGLKLDRAAGSREHFLGVRGRERVQWLPLDESTFVQSATVTHDGPGILTPEL